MLASNPPFKIVIITIIVTINIIRKKRRKVNIYLKGIQIFYGENKENM